MKRITCIIFYMHSFMIMVAQQNLGIRNSNYAGIQSAALNPAALADSKIKWDINLISLGTIFDNNFMFIPKSSLRVLGFKTIITDALYERDFYSRFNPKNPNELFNATYSTELMGPSFIMNVGNNSAIGFTTAGRVYGNISNITNNIAENAFSMLLEKSLWNKDFLDNTAKVNAMAWFEYGLNYATLIHKKANSEFKGGITVKYLQGAAGVYFNSTSLTYNIHDTTRMTFTNSSIDYGRTSYDIYKNITGYNDLNNGYGFGGNIGFTYVRLKISPYNEEGGRNQVATNNKYVYRIGVSLIDIGSIKFNRNAAAYHLQTDSADYFHWSHSPVSSQIQFDRTMSAVFYHGDSARSLIKNNFDMALPAALSMQADWNFYQNFFIDATIVKGFGHGNKPGVVRPDIYSLTPRYESKWFEASLPISLIYYHRWQARTGVAFRIGYFFFGGDALGSLFKLSDFERTDFYGGIHFFVRDKKNK